ncbi:autotransporter outer membrane beta-barrel domain-containing protein [Phascolarctobacterium faecium]|nr:autotransporter outer membrane beta-barrel domain-containing protein [Phascolarctobacterium faecium]MDM8111684.1 autotransporter outer membrane beta-barrel domain-containing protein [Phascolarctobacterium faecium]
MKKNIRSKILLCVLAGGVLAANTALANSIGTVIVDGEPKTIYVSKEYYSIGRNDAENVQITSGSGNSGYSLNITSPAKGTINGQQLNFNGGIYCRYNGVKLEIGTKGVTNTVSINSSNTHVVFSSNSAQVNINADNININSHADGDAPAVWVQKGGFVNLNGENININAKNYGLIAFSGSELNVNGNLVVNVVNAKNAIDTRGNAIININTDGKHTTVLNGDIVFETPYTDSGSVINSNININLSGEESSWTGRAYQEYNVKVENESGGYKLIYSAELKAPDYCGDVTGFKMNINDGASWNMTGDSFINNITVENGGVVNVQENVKAFNVGTAADKGGITLNNGIINLQGENQQITVTELDGTGGTVNTNSLYNKMNIKNVDEDTAITVNGSGEIADAIYGGDATAQNLADVVTTGTKSAASQITTDEGIIAGKITADVKDGEVTNYTVAKNTTNVGISNLAAINLVTWRQENNDMNKRLGELRDSKGEHGVWARMVRGEVEYESIQNQYNYYQIGYDEKLSTDPNWTVGMFLTRTEGNSTFRTGSAENNHTGVGVYGSYLKDDGSFIDLVAKYARIDSDFNANGGVGSGDYNTNGYSISAEYGKRFEQGNGFWIEPQVELTYGTVGAVDYTTGNGAKVRQEGMDSLVGRVGFSIGKDIKAGNIYARASYLYDFDGETEVTMSHSGISDVYEQDLGGGWFEVGLGANINLSDATHLYFDVEKTYGGDVATPWQWSAGMRWTF